MPANVSQKAKQKANTVQTLQASLGITGPKEKRGNGAGRQTIPESLGLGRTGKRTSTKVGRGHLRDAMGLG